MVLHQQYPLMPTPRIKIQYDQCKFVKTPHQHADVIFEWSLLVQLFRSLLDFSHSCWRIDGGFFKTSSSSPSPSSSSMNTAPLKISKTEDCGVIILTFVSFWHHLTLFSASSPDSRAFCMVKYSHKKIQTNLKIMILVILNQQCWTLEWVCTAHPIYPSTKQTRSWYKWKQAIAEVVPSSSSV